MQLVGVGTGIRALGQPALMLSLILLAVSHALQQLNGDVTLEVPDVPIDSVDKAAADTELVMSLEQYMSEWSSTLASVMQVRNMLACLRLVFKDVTM
eukprot:scaffold98306_cov23-Tisochrysis_lutea.AAC.2